MPNIVGEKVTTQIKKLELRKLLSVSTQLRSPFGPFFLGALIATHVLPPKPKALRASKASRKPSSTDHPWMYTDEYMNPHSAAKLNPIQELPTSDSK
ncbi:hypothetical protein SD80_024870 [Scytonema tolypothrichoides VB-61278]|nr:hypothetical protein SD80_024870 [Scytonema tolypothrichoides VB-61278]